MGRYMEWQQMAQEDKYRGIKSEYPGRRIWDNGVNPLLDKLGYVHKEASGVFFRPEHTKRGSKSTRQSGEVVLDDNGEPITSIDDLVGGFKGLFLNPSRRMAKHFQELYYRSSTRIQARARGYLVRNRIWRAKEAARIAEEDQAASIEIEIGMRKAEKEDARKKLIEKVTTFGFSMKKNLQRSVTKEVEATVVRSKALHKAVSREIITRVESGAKAVQKVKEEVQVKIQESKEQAKEAAEKARTENIRRQRLVEHEFAIEDAVFNVRGLEDSRLPRLNRKWYIGLFPQIEEYEMDEASAQQEYLGGHDSELAYEMVKGTKVGEAVRSATMSPFGKESVHRLNFNTHFADVQKYTRILLVVFIEAGDEHGDGVVRPDALPSNIAVPQVGRSISRQNVIGATFLPIFFGSVQLNGGLAYAPTGGRMIVVLRQNPNQPIFLSRAQAKRLSRVKHLRMTCSLCPVAIPGSPFLYSLMCKTLPRPTYPSEFIDAYLFEKYELDVKEFYGAAICMVRFAGRDLISTRHRGLPHGVLEFTSHGKCLGKIIDHQPEMGTIQAMIAAHDHLLCCGSTGAVGIYMDNNPGADIPSITCVRFMELHEWPIVLCAAVHRAGIDFFFTVDRKDHIGIILMEKGTLLRTFVNECFVISRITSLVVSRDKLYLGLANGHLLTVDLTEVMNGNIEVARALSKCVIGRDTIFDDTVGITCMAICSHADLFGLRNEDTENTELVNVDVGEVSILPTNVRVKQKPRLVGMRLRPQDRLHAKEPSVDDGCYEKNSRLNPGAPLEGHVIIVAGGSDHLIRILRPLNPRIESIGGFREVGRLSGHTATVSQVVVDAAGRFIVSSSQTSHHLNVWNATTFNCEKSHENVNAGFIGLGNNVMYLCSFKAPFITVWRIPEKSPTKKKKYQKRLTYAEDTISGLEGNVDEVLDGRPHIAMIRTNLWCSTTVAGGRAIPQRSVGEAIQFLGPEGCRVVDDWRNYYDRGVKVVSKLAPPVVPKKCRSSNSLPSIEQSNKRSIRSKRQLQKLATADNISLGTGRTSNWDTMGMQDTSDSEESISITKKEKKSTSAYDYTDPETGYNRIHQCYYDANGYAYNYDETGQYYYCDAAFYMNLPQIVEVDDDSTDGNMHQGVDGSSLVSGSANFDNIAYGAPYSTPDADKNSRRSPDLDNYGTTPESPEIHQWTAPGSHLEEVSPEAPATSSKTMSKGDAKDYDNYGYYIGSRGDDYDFGNAFYTTGHSYDPPSAHDHFSAASEGGGMEDPRNKRNPISFKRRHMHMSDSDEEEDEKMTSIYRHVSRQTAHVSSPEKVVDYSPEYEEPGYASTEWYSTEADTYDYSDNQALQGQNTGHDGPHSDAGGDKDDSSDRNSDVSAAPALAPLSRKVAQEVKLEAERKSRFDERRKFIRRGLLHHLAEDESDDDDDV